jgi:hypothetical protein
MSVVVNEFEVVPAPERPPAPASAPLEPAVIDVERDVVRILELERSRAARIHAC